MSVGVPPPHQYCVCKEDCSSSICMCGQLSLRCWYDKVRTRVCGDSFSGSARFSSSMRCFLCTARPPAARVLPGGAPPHLRVQPRMLLLEDLQEPRSPKRTQVFLSFNKNH